MAGAVAAMTGFGIGSLITPLFALSIDMRLAIAAVSIPHVIGTGVRFGLLRGRVDRQVFIGFGLTSAAGGLAGAALHEVAGNRALNIVFGLLLIVAAISEGSGLAGRLRISGWLAWAAGALSGFLGGLVGNQGGIRSAALVGFNLPRETFVATATAIALAVDGARVPFYVATQHAEMLALWPVIAVAVAGVTGGTLLGTAALARLPDIWFRRVLAITLAALGVVMLTKAFAQ